jgi:hypothetical protein
MKPHALVCNLMYQQDSLTGRGDLLRLLKYVQYRDDRDSHLLQQIGQTRWYDRGLGNHYRMIARLCSQLARDPVNQDAVLVRMMVVSPHPTLMTALPPAKRQTALRDLTESMIEGYFAARELPVPEYAFVIHDPQTEGGVQRMHSHVFFPATVPDLEGRRAYDLRRKQMPEFHVVRDQTITQFWTRLVGAERLNELDQQLTTETDTRRQEREQTDLERGFGLSR